MQAHESSHLQQNFVGLNSATGLKLCPENNPLVLREHRENVKGRDSKLIKYFKKKKQGKMRKFSKGEI